MPAGEQESLVVASEVGLDQSNSGVDRGQRVGAGWFVDPSVPGYLRWWNGQYWTHDLYPDERYAVLHRRVPATVARDLALDLAREERTGKRARAALVGAAVAYSIYFLVFGLLQRLFTSQVVNSSTQSVVGSPQRDKAPPDQTYQVVASVGVLAVEATVLVAGAFFVVWMFQATSIAKRRGIRARWNPIFAIFSFLIPFLTYVVPYQAVRDALPKGHPARRLVRWWWGLYLAMNLLMIVVFLVTSLSLAVSVGVVLVGVAAAISSVLVARQMIVAINRAHAEMLGNESTTAAS
ncbi:MAG: DUF4328 domain-containing protein [Actinomycetes bacterium]